MDPFKKKLRIPQDVQLHLLYPPTDFSLKNGEVHSEVNRLPTSCSWMMVFVRSNESLEYRVVFEFQLFRIICCEMKATAFLPDFCAFDGQICAGNDVAQLAQLR